MRTLGVDLSASPKKTAACLLVWKGGQAAAEELFSGLDDQAIVDRMAAAHWTRIDAPFGWPADYIEAITQWATEGAWPREVETDCASGRQTGSIPFRVSGDSFQRVNAAYSNIERLRSKLVDGTREALGYLPLAYDADCPRREDRSDCDEQTSKQLDPGGAHIILSLQPIGSAR